MKFTNALSLGVVFATAFTVTTAAPISTSIAARDAHYVAMARSIQELDARDPFSFGSFFKAIAPIAKPFVAKIPKVGGFLSKFLKRDGTIDEDLLKDFLVTEALAGRGDIVARSLAEDLVARDPWSWRQVFNVVAPIVKPWVEKIPDLLTKIKRDGTVDEDLLKDFLVAEALAGRGDIAARSLAEDLVARDPFSFGNFFKAIAPIAKPFVAKIPKVGGILSKFFKRDGTVDEDLLKDFLVAEALAGRGDIAARSLSEDLEARDPFSFGSFFKAIAPIAKPFIEKIPKVGGILSKFFKRDGTIDEELLNDFITEALASRSVVARSSFRRGEDLNDDDVAGLIAELVADLKPAVSRRDTAGAEAWNDFVNAIVDAQ